MVKVNYSPCILGIKGYPQGVFLILPCFLGIEVCRRQGRKYQADRGSTGSQRIRGTPHRQPGTTHEKARHYLWRFWTRLPKTGHIAIFDRTWYGRVMVERLEGFCSTNDWQRAYNEINEFEKELSQWGAVIIKFWVQIDKDTQLERFTERQNTPEKQWKITDEDWRNRDKWDQYEDAVNEMLQKTSTEYAPWHILESVDKKYARIKALKIVIEELEKALG